MKSILAGLFMLLLWPCLGYGLEYNVNWNFTFAPPHHEPVVGNRVARYRLYVEPEIHTKYADFSLISQTWFRQKWQPSVLVGHGIEAWKNSDWGFDDTKTSVTFRTIMSPFEDKRVGLFVEYYMPLSRTTWGGHGMETNYYLLVGVGGKF